MNQHAQRPNILLIIMDTVRADHLSCYGYPLPTTPHLDRLAEEGVRFTNAISTGGWTVPTHASLFTGTFPGFHGARDGHPILNENIPTLAETLGNWGYQRAGFTNVGWLNENAGLTRGFDTFVQVYRLHQGRSIPVLIRRVLSKILWMLLGRKLAGASLTNRYVKRWLAHRESARPFFIFINYSEAHAPYQPPRSFAHRFLEPYGLSFSEAQRVNYDPVKHVTGTVPMDERDFNVLRALYDAEIAYLDTKLGELFSYLDRQNLMDQTLIIVSADHGENFGDHGLMGHKWCLYDTLLRVPLIIRYPSCFTPGTTIDDQVQLVDIFPTLMEVLDIHEPKIRDQLQGFSLLPDQVANRPRKFAVAERAGRSWQSTFSRHSGFDYEQFERDLKAIRTPRFKYIWASNGRHELYEIATDHAETRNLVDVYPKEAQRLQDCLFDFINSIQHPDATAEGDIELDRVLEQHLRDLGYID
jgi:arylsulfatase A-like enzyme